MKLTYSSQIWKRGRTDEVGEASPVLEEGQWGDSLAEYGRSPPRSAGYGAAPQTVEYFPSEAVAMEGRSGPEAVVARDWS